MNFKVFKTLFTPEKVRSGKFHCLFIFDFAERKNCFVSSVGCSKLIYTVHRGLTNANNRAL